MADENIYGTLKDTRSRLQGTIVLYDSKPYYVFAIGGHKEDGIFRGYIMPLESRTVDPTKERFIPRCYVFDNVSQDSTAFGPAMDDWIEKEGKAYGVIRKKLNSPSFNKFRPFPLGMCNVNNGVYYIERQPARRSEQGLSQTSTTVVSLSMTPTKESRSRGFGSGPVVDTFSTNMVDTILGRYPTAQECMKEMKDPDVINDGVAFDRHFALLRGPCDMFFIAYKADIIGVLPNADLSALRIANRFKYAREAAQQTGYFGTIEVK